MKISLILALSRSILKRCPRCGKASIYKRYLKLKSNCNHCDEQLSIYRTDDFGPWLTIIIAGHIIVPLVLFIEQVYAPDLWLQAVTWIPLTIATVLFILPVSKSICLAILWNINDK